MLRLSQALISPCLIGVGLLVCALSANSLLSKDDLKFPLNPLGINHSPYGEVFAMALQGPISSNFEIGMYGVTHSHTSHPADRHPNNDHSSLGSLQSMLAKMETGHEERTNPRPASETLKFYLKRAAEDKLRFAYNLDPSHYANYASLHFFLIEGISTRPELILSAAQLAEETIAYCKKQQGDPRPVLTEAAAYTNILHLMFADQLSSNPKYSTLDMRECIRKLDESIAKYDQIAAIWDRDHLWQRISNRRFNDCIERYEFICKIRDAAEKTIIRIENHQLPQNDS